MPDDTRSASPALRIFLWSRAAIWVVAVITVVFFERDLNPGGEWDSPRLHELGTVIDVWARWDSDWFLKIAEEGYSWPSSTPAFLPLYPFLVAVLGFVLLGHPLLAGVIVSLVAGSAAFVLLYRLAAAKLGAAAAQRTVLFLALAPTSLFFGAVYSESLFLLFAVAHVSGRREGELLEGWWPCRSCAPDAIGRNRAAPRAPRVRVAGTERGGRSPAWPSRPPSSSLYPLLLGAVDRRPLAFLDAQKVVWERHLSPPGPIGGLIAAVQYRQVLDLAAVVSWSCSAWWRGGESVPHMVSMSSPASCCPFAVYSKKAPLLSMQRFVIVAFPAFMALATVVRTRRATFITATILSAGLVVYVVRWALWYWVA